MNKIKAQYIAGVESLSNEALHQALSALDKHEIGCVNWAEFPYKPSAGFHIAYSDKAVAIMFEVTEDHVRAVAMENNGPVWEDSCVETFIKDPVGEGYYNIEVNCIGTKLAAHRLSRTDFELFDESRLSEIRCRGSLPHQKTDIQNQEWTLLKVIPFSVLGLDKAPQSLNVNFYKCGDNCRQPHYLSWSPIALEKPNFHCPEFFGEIILKK
jgi:hypothetical protein